MATFRPNPLIELSKQIDDLARDPSLWADVLGRISEVSGSTGAIILQADAITSNVPITASVDDAFKRYFRDGWNQGNRDLRTRGIGKLLQGHVVTDEDVVTYEEMQKSSFYNDAVRAGGLEWYAGVGFWSGPVLWCLCIQRNASEGAFDQDDKRLFSTLSKRLTEVATLSRLAGQASLKDTFNALDHLDHAAIAIDHLGRVISTTKNATDLFDDYLYVANKRLVVRDEESQKKFASLLAQVRLAANGVAMLAEPFVIRRGMSAPLVARTLPASGSASEMFLGARAIIVLTEIRSKQISASILSNLYRLTPTESRVAMHLSSGLSLEEVCATLAMARETGRVHLKAILRKTDTHRQGELVSLLSSIRC